MTSSDDRTSARVAAGIWFVVWLIFQVIALTNGWRLLEDLLGPVILASAVAWMIMAPIESARYDHEQEQKGRPKRKKRWDDW